MSAGAGPNLPGAPAAAAAAAALPPSGACLTRAWLLPCSLSLQGEMHWTLNVTDAAPGDIQASIEDGDPTTSTALGKQQPPHLFRLALQQIPICSRH